MFKGKIKATILDVEIDHEITYPHEINADYMNNCLHDSGTASAFDDGSVDLQVHYLHLVIRYYVNGKEYTENLSDCYTDRVLKKGEIISVKYDPVSRTVSVPFYC